MKSLPQKAAKSLNLYFAQVDTLLTNCFQQYLLLKDLELQTSTFKQTMTSLDQVFSAESHSQIQMQLSLLSNQV
jgi:hypothetical protein